jgi:peptidoglycan/xylan/chitin deacetylase (PgdA/CDA1 family)
MPALILMYHDLAADARQVAPGHRPYVLEPSAFSFQMQAVAAQAVPVLGVTQWCTSARPPRAVLLTFDDGHVSNHDMALPILLEHQLKATFFVVAGHIATAETMTWRQIRALHAAGMEIGSHTLTHRPPITLDDDTLRYELSESRRILEDGLGAPVTSISSPTGFFNPRMRRIAREAGYRALCFGRVGLASDHGDPFSLKRIAVKRAMTPDQFNALMRLDPAAIRRLRLRQMIRVWARKTVGRSAYLRMRRMLIQGEPAC